MSDRKERQPKPYRSPRLKEYGSITAITRTSGDKNKMPDGMKGKFNKT
jgi:hypothetical protein